ncbi:hypothetical protein PFICI_01842 [Pestalotiopsis fici W106-1]|uniref:DUF7708 domain-containing protein n=1 Tax=Pestalotiopsis fici (strain W106-1 / CGMCC3.15140) TaxID=1229662 RepID=W3XPV1_PESFW|nr:uncharacterized protein PFICI_01842 [Pestalotiopsis fici W106-1]ETS88014.1 hypothetical protein PFICI_01842 [Pestalotiopsis fici W106-1]
MDNLLDSWPKEVGLQKTDLDSREFIQLVEIEEKQKCFHAWLERRQLALEERQALHCRNYGEFAAYWSEVSEGAQSSFSLRHEKGWRKWTKTCQSYAIEIHDLMMNIKPLLDIVSSLGAPYSGAAIGTLTGLFAIAVTKTELDSTVCSAITGIRDRLPGFQMYEKIYQHNSDLKKKIALSYIRFIELSMSITKYCLRSGSYRWAIALFDPTKFMDQMNLANEAVMQVRLKCEELLNERVYDLDKHIKSLKTETLDLKTEIRGLRDSANRVQKEKHTEVLLSLKADLGIQTFDFQLQRQELDKYHKGLLNESREEGHFFQQMSAHRIKELQETRAFVSWSTDDTSSVLFLQGQNSPEIGYHKSSSWISPFAVDQVMQLQKTDPGDPFGYCMLPEDSSGIHSVLPRILFHLLNHRLCDLGPSENRSKLQHEIKMYAACHLDKQTSERRRAPSSEGDKDDEPTAILQRVALAVLALYPAHQPVRIVLDRIDRCPKDEQYDLMDLLGSLIQKAACNLKILCVADSAAWSVSKATYGRTFGGRVHLVELQQKLLTMGGETDY